MPPRQAPPAAPSKKLIAQSDYGEEGELIDTRSEASSWNSDLDDFVVDDSSIAEEEKELDLADAEDDNEGVLSDISLSGITSKLSTARKLVSKRSSKYVATDDEDDEPMLDASEDPFSSPLHSLDHDTPIKEEQVLPRCSATLPNDSTDIVDLTMLSSDDAHLPTSMANENASPGANFCTPQKKTSIKLVNRNSPINLVSDSDDAQSPYPKNLSPLQDTRTIAKFSHLVWVKLGDRERLLISVLHGMPVRMRNSIFALISDIQDQVWPHIVEVINVIRRKGESVKGMDDNTFRVSCPCCRTFVQMPQGD